MSDTEITNNTRDDLPWHAIRLFTIKQKEIDETLRQEGFETFIPMEKVDRRDSNNRLVHELRPVVRNLIFFKKKMDDKYIRETLVKLPYKMSVIRKNQQSAEYALISAKEMHEFQAMCNPDLAMKTFISEDQAKLKKGTPVIVTHGPLKGMRGKLVRSNKMYYLLKDVPGIAVMIKVTRWCCKPLSIGQEATQS